LFCFSAARLVPPVLLAIPGRAAEKQKKELSGRVSTNMAPLMGF
jgi:hypothetical protein